MTRLVLAVVFALGLSAVLLVGLGFVGSSWTALVMIGVIGAVYLVGALEIRRFRAATASLGAALANIPQPLDDIGAWIAGVHPSLQTSVRLRIDGERVALPGPALTPYLVGLLVMLGMLGTFLGMVLTFKGAVFALEGSTDLQAIRSALAAPIKGLGLAFGTSVAGVASSAMLGLLSAISRRERSEVARQLDGRIATSLRPFSHRYQQQETFKAIQAQARALPAVVDQLHLLSDGLERRGQALGDQLLGQQARFHDGVRLAYTDLASAVETSMKDSLAASARAAAESLSPVVAAAMAGIAHESRRAHERAGEAAALQLQALSDRFAASAGTLVVRSEALVESRIASEDRWTRQQGERMEQLAGLWRHEIGALRADEAARAELAALRLEALRSDEAARGEAAVARLGDLQAALATQLATLGAALEAPLTRMLQTASEVPQAASEVMAQLRQEMGRMAARDNRALDEHTQLVQRIGALLQTIDQSASAQRAAIDTLVASAAASLDQTGKRFSQALGTQLGQVQAVAAQVTGSALELSSLGESFGHGVQVFSTANHKLMESLQRMEVAIQQSMARSDEQLAYYVAQAREVIDLSISAQQGIVEDLRRLDGRKAALPAGGV